MSTCPQVGSIFNEGICKAQAKTWESSAIPRTMKPTMPTTRLSSLERLLYKLLVAVCSGF